MPRRSSFQRPSTLQRGSDKPFPQFDMLAAPAGVARHFQAGRGGSSLSSWMSGQRRYAVYWEEAFSAFSASSFFIIAGETTYSSTSRNTAKAPCAHAGRTQHRNARACQRKHERAEVQNTSEMKDLRVLSFICIFTEETAGLHAGMGVQRVSVGGSGSGRGWRGSDSHLARARGSAAASRLPEARTGASA